MAYVFDSWLLLGAGFGGGVFGSMLANALAAGARDAAHARSAGEAGFLFGWVFWGAAAWILNFGILQGMTGASLGKMIFKLRVVQVGGSPIGVPLAFGRSAAQVLSILPCWLGYAPILWSARRQGLHDLVCGTVVIRKDARYPEEAPLSPNLLLPLQARKDAGSQTPKDQDPSQPRAA